MDLNVIIGKRVQAIRIAKGISIEDFGRTTGLSIEEVGEIERGALNMHLSQFLALSEGLSESWYCIMPDSFFEIHMNGI